MGKVEEQHQQQQQIQGTPPTRSSRGLFCERCSMGLDRIAREINFKCVVVLLLSLAVFLSAIFWILPHRASLGGFDAKDAIKLSATVQVYFKLQKPVSLLVPQIERLEYDIFGEIGVPDTKVAILSMHQASGSNFTDVVFGVLSNPMNASINPAFLSVLRLSLIDLFLQQYNLTLTSSIFGQPSSLQILEFPGGITVNPAPYAIWQIPQMLFNFTLNNSISDIRNNFYELREQLKFGLHLMPYENLYVWVTNKYGSTRDPPVRVQASITSDLGSLLPQRLKQLAQIITGSPPAKNLGLDNSVFGKVKEISLSSCLNATFRSTPPTPSPAPSPAPSPSEKSEDSTSSDPALSPYSPAPSPDFHHRQPCFNCEASSPSMNGYQNAPSPESGPYHSLPPTASSPSPSRVTADRPLPCPYRGSRIPPSSTPISRSEPPVPSAISPPAAAPYSPIMGPTAQLPPDLSPLPVVSYGSSPGQDKESGKGSVSPSPLLSSFPPSSSGSSYKEIWLLVYSGFAMVWILFGLC